MFFSIRLAYKAVLHFFVSTLDGEKMQLVIRFMKSIFAMKAPWPFWVAMLMGVNMMGPLFFIHTLEGQCGAGFHYSRRDTHDVFLRPLWIRLASVGLGHIFWVPLVIWLASTRIQHPFTDHGCAGYVTLYCMGDRKLVVPIEI